MLMTPITPKVMARPIAASSRTEPSERPYHVFCSRSHSASELEIDVTAAAADHGHRIELVGLAGIRRVEDDGGTGLLERPFDARIAFLGDGGFQRRKGARLARLEQRLSGVG